MAKVFFLEPTDRERLWLRRYRNVANGATPCEKIGNCCNAMFQLGEGDIRYTADGYIDARDGSTYRTDVQVPYDIGQTFKLRFVVDTLAHRYSLYSVGSYYPQTIASNYAFRTEQASASTLRTMAAYVDNTNPDFELIACDLAEMY